ncbi:MAG: acyltransferase, partial [Nitriliruptoraceae bacterium]
MSDGAVGLTPEQIDARTPAGRNRYADALRLTSIIVVVLGHWLLAVVSARGGRLEGVNLLALHDGTHWLTWIFQVMPLFFFVGGYANAAAYRSARRRGVGWADWVRGRARRLLRPVMPLVVLWTPVVGVLAVLGVPRSMLQFASQVAIVPVWFLAAYLVVCAVVPLTYPLHERLGVGMLAAMVGVAVAVDVVHLAGVPLVGWSNYVWIWGAVHQAGYLWHDADRVAADTLATATRAVSPQAADVRASARWFPHTSASAVGVALCGYGMLVVLTQVLDYPISMVGVDGATRSNNSPP